MEIEASYNRPSYKDSQHSKSQNNKKLDVQQMEDDHVVEGEDSNEKINLQEEDQMNKIAKQQSSIQSENEEKNKINISNQDEEEKISKENSGFSQDQSEEKDRNSDKSDEISENKSEESDDSSDLKTQVLNLNCKYILKVIKSNIFALADVNQIENNQNKKKVTRKKKKREKIKSYSYWKET